MKIIVGTDHAGVKAKQKIVEWLKKNNYNVEDVGSFDQKAPDDYPDFAKKVVRKVKGTNNKGVLICTTGTGMVIAANRFKGIRASLAYDKYSAVMSRRDNNANVLTLRAKGYSARKHIGLIKIWLNTPFSNQARHKRRVKKLDK